MIEAASASDSHCTRGPLVRSGFVFFYYCVKKEHEATGCERVSALLVSAHRMSFKYDVINYSRVLNANYLHHRARAINNI